MGKEFLRKTARIVGGTLVLSALAVAAQISDERGGCASKPEFSRDFQAAVCTDGEDVQLELANGVSAPFKGRLLGWNDQIGQGYVAIGVEEGGDCLISVVSQQGEVFPIPNLAKVEGIHWVFSRDDGDYVRYSWNLSNVIITEEVKLERGAAPLTITAKVTGQPLNSGCRL